MTNKDGGPAFPTIIPLEHSDAQGKDYPNYSESGMTLRDWFAGQVIMGMAARVAFDPGQATPGQRARLAYIDADAMIAEREK